MNDSRSIEGHTEQVNAEPARQRSWPIFWPIVVMVLFSLCFHFTSADIAISSLFFDRATETWPAMQLPTWRAFYRIGTYPPLLIVGTAVSMLVAPTFGLLPTKFRWQGLFLILVILIGPLLIVERGFKEFWGRARPREVKEFRGQHDYSSHAVPSFSMAKNSSFPSGHAAIAFYAMAPAFICRNRFRAGLWFAFGSTYGLLMSLTRVMQGGHFASDVFWSGAILYLCCAILSRVMHIGLDEPRAEAFAQRSPSGP